MALGTERFPFTLHWINQVPEEAGVYMLWRANGHQFGLSSSTRNLRAALIEHYIEDMTLRPDVFSFQLSEQA